MFFQQTNKNKNTLLFFLNVGFLILSQACHIEEKHRSFDSARHLQ